MKEIRETKAQKGLLRVISNFFLDIFFPRTCFGCGKEGRYICKNCQTFLGEAPLICPVCRKGSFSGQRHSECPAKNQLDGLVAVWEYEGLMKTAIGQVKYRKVGDAISELVALSWKTMREDQERFAFFFHYLLSEKPSLSFIPLSSRKKKRRGFNQAELIARELSQQTGLETIPLLEKTRETKSQTKLNKEERIKNIKGSFSLKINDRKLPENLILVDDVWTTGATMKEVGRILKEAGLKKIWGFTLARTV